MATSEPVRLALRKLWSDHVIWTREYIVAAVAGTPDAGRGGGPAAAATRRTSAPRSRLLRSGRRDRLTELLKQHILIAVDLVAAAKTGDKTAFATHDARWTANIEEIAAFLAGANPNWPEARSRPARAAPQAHQGRGRRPDQRDWAADVKAFDDIFTEIMVLADTLHDGIEAQFPERFRVAVGMTPGAGRGAPPRARPCRSAPATAVDGLLGTDGRVRSRRPRGPAPLVVVFSSNRCPTAKAYDERMNALQREYRPVASRWWRSTRTTRTSTRTRATADGRAGRRGRYRFPYVVDPGQRVAKAFGATCTFHVFVLDGARRLRYQGRFDDSRLPDRVTSHDLRNALDDVLAGGRVRARTRPFGCSLDFV